MPPGKQPPATLETAGFGGLNTALQFSQIPREQSPSMKNAYMPKIGAIGKRPGTIPVSNTLAANIQHLTVYRTTASEDILASSGTTLYKYNGTDTLTAQTMTNALVTADIYTVAFTDINNVSILFITDGGSVKQYNGTAVANITPAANDASPNPPNDLVNINAKNPIYCWVYSSHVFITDGKDIVWYSKRYYYDYFPSVQYERWVRENDYITGPGIGFNNVCLIPMRRGWGMLTGSTVDNFDGNQFINTANGNIAPRSIQKITYPDGGQTIAYLSDDGVHEIYDTGAQDAGSRQYSTRSLMKDKIDFNAIGFTEAEKKAAVAYFDQTLYILAIKQGANNYAFVYDTRNKEWYQWTNMKVKSMVKKGDILYYAGEDKHLRKLDKTLYSDWDNAGKTSGTAVYFQRYSPALALEFSGYESYWDYYLVEAKQFTVPSTLDIKVIFSASTVELLSALKNEIFVWGASKWGEAKWANVDYSDIVNEPNELIFHKKAKYAQIVWENNRDEPTELYKDRFKGRVSGR